MAKKNVFLNLIVWLTGIIVALAVGFALISGTLSVPYIGIANVIAGWVVVVTTVLAAAMSLIK